MDGLMFVVAMAVIGGGFVLGAALPLSGVLIATVIACVIVGTCIACWHHFTNPLIATALQFLTFGGTVGTAFMWFGWLFLG